MMARRTPYTSLRKQGQERPSHVVGMGDVVFRGFQCLNGDCQEFITVREDELEPRFKITCPSCDFVHETGELTRFFYYQLVHRQDGNVIEEGEFLILHDDYINESQRLKYCLICYTRKPLDLFGRHRRRKSGRQGECKLCKTVYNSIKNQSRLTDQHREASQRRRLYQLLAGETQRIDSKEVFDKFQGVCFNCNRELHYTTSGQQDFNLDHTLPARLLWPITTDNATLLCSSCNNEKHDQWPLEFYGIHKLRALSRLTGYSYAILSGQPMINESAVEEIINNIDIFIENWIQYPEEIKRIRRIIMEYVSTDIYDGAAHIPPHLLESDAV